MATERMRVLELIREGKVSVDEGVRLLEALGDERAPAPPAGRAPARRRLCGRDQGQRWPCPLRRDGGGPQ